MSKFHSFHHLNCLQHSFIIIIVDTSPFLSLYSSTSWTTQLSFHFNIKIEIIEILNYSLLPLSISLVSPFVIYELRYMLLTLPLTIYLPPNHSLKFSFILLTYSSFALHFPIVPHFTVYYLALLYSSLIYFGLLC